MVGGSGTLPVGLGFWLGGGFGGAAAAAVRAYVREAAAGFRLEDHEAGPMPRLIKERKSRGITSPSKAGGTWRWVPAKEERDWSFVHISFP